MYSRCLFLNEQKENAHSQLFIVNSFEYTMGKWTWPSKHRFILNHFRERSGSVVKCLTEGPRVRASPASLRCVNEQNTLILV